MAGRPPRAAIIGAGIGGLATANVLARAGWQVDVYEQQAAAGGRAGQLTIDGFRFDSGPSWYLMPDVYEHYYQLLGEQVGEQLELQRLQPGYKTFFDYRQPLVMGGAEARDQTVFESLQPGGAEALKRYLDSAEQAYKMAMRYFLYNSFGSKAALFNPAVSRRAGRLGRLLLQPLHGYVRRYFSALPLQQIVEYPAVFLGTSPFSAPALYHLMSYIDLRQGVWYPRGGMYKIVESLERLGRRAGVSYHYSSPVRRIMVDGKRARGLELADGRRVMAEAVISNADLHYTETQLLPPAAQSYPEAFWRRRTAAPSALLMYLGVRGALPELEHHNLFLVKAWQANFAAIFDSRTVPDAASLYVSKTTATDPDMAPAGHEALFVLVPLPADEQLDGQRLQEVADRSIDFIGRRAGVPDLARRIVVKRLFTPADFATQFHAWHGTALGLAHSLRQSALLRPANRSRRLTNLLYVGGDVRPGIGIPMCLIGAELVYKQLAGDRSAGPLAVPLAKPAGAWHV